jgi:hypothetical protein
VVKKNDKKTKKVKKKRRKKKKLKKKMKKTHRFLHSGIFFKIGATWSDMEWHGLERANLLSK